MSFYDIYHQQQYGGGGRGVNHVFVGATRQRGHGLGSFFTGLFRSALPYITKGARVVGREALRSGVNILDDISDGNMSFKDSLKNRADESVKNLKRKAVKKLTTTMMEGNGYKTGKRRRRNQSQRRVSVRRKSSVKRLKPRRKTKPRRARKNLRKKSKKSKRSNRKNKTIDIFR